MLLDARNNAASTFQVHANLWHYRRFVFNSTPIVPVSSYLKWMPACSRAFSIWRQSRTFLSQCLRLVQFAEGSLSSARRASWVPAQERGAASGQATAPPMSVT